MVVIEKEHMVESGKMKKSELKALIAKGEDSRLQFKEDCFKYQTSFMLMGCL